MKTLFDPSVKDDVVRRIGSLAAGSTRQWGKMQPAQMLAHCAIGLEAATGDTSRKQKLLGKLLGPFFRSAFLGEKPFGRNSPTDPAYVVSDERSLDAERDRLLAQVDLFCRRGPDAVSRRVHVFFGRLTGEEWGVLQYKHLDHHLRQFGA